jgi:hypothetical protein
MFGLCRKSTLLKVQTALKESQGRETTLAEANRALSLEVFELQRMVETQRYFRDRVEREAAGYLRELEQERASSSAIRQTVADLSTHGGVHVILNEDGEAPAHMTAMRAYEAQLAVQSGQTELYRDRMGRPGDERIPIFIDHIQYGQLHELAARLKDHDETGARIEYDYINGQGPFEVEEEHIKWDD